MGATSGGPTISVRPSIVVPIGTRRFESHYQRPEYYTGCFSVRSGSGRFGLSAWACRDDHDGYGWGLRNTISCYGTRRYAHSRGLTRYYNRRWHGRVCYGDSYFYPSYYPTFFPTYGGSSRTYIYNNYSDYSQEYDVSDGSDWQGNLPASVRTDQAEPTTTDSYTHTQLGLSAFVDGDYEVARREFVRAILASPEDAERLMLYGYAHFATGDYLVASMAIKRALSLDSSLIESPIDLLSLYQKEEKFEEHQILLDGYVGSHSDDGDAAFLAGFVRYASGQASAAADMFGEQVDAGEVEAVVWLLRDAAMRVAHTQQLMRAAEMPASVVPDLSESPESDVPATFFEAPAVPIESTEEADELPGEVL